MGIGCSILSLSPSALPLKPTATYRSRRYTNSFSSFPLHITSQQVYHRSPYTSALTMSLSSSSISPPLAAWRPGGSDELLSDEFMDKVVKDALVWSALHGFVVGDRSNSVLEIFSYLSMCGRLVVSVDKSKHMFLNQCYYEELSSCLVENFRLISLNMGFERV